jgi:hypothetical protein
MESGVSLCFVCWTGFVDWESLAPAVGEDDAVVMAIVTYQSGLKPATPALLWGR